MVNLLHTDSGNKVDFWLLTDDEFDRNRFARGTMLMFAGVRFEGSRPEDTILQKLKWLRETGGVSEKQFRDAVAVFEVQFRQLDQPYLDDWAARIGVTDYLRRVRDAATPL
ncbi:MAG TPA: hypothetical protein VEA69_11025 [Tepidisphaeraceae bacterium]|nr:hypothetical protein [Tepidisphaeraceae bacterium]